MSIFDIFGLSPEELSEFLKRWHINISSSHIQTAIDVGVWILIIWILISKILWPALRWLWNLMPCSLNKTKGAYIHAALDHDFAEQLGEENKQQYIETHFTSLPPHEFDDPIKSTTASTRESMTAFCDRILAPDNPNDKLYIVLAGSGMGKTTFMVNIFCHYVNLHMTREGMPLDIKLLRLDDENIIDRIKSLSTTTIPGKTILLLDALDENRDASENFSGFKEELESVIEPYKLVIITCRDQFFESEKDIPEETRWVSSGKEKNLINYFKVYISPFTDSDVDKYLSIKYRKWKHRKKRKQARQIVSKCRSLMVRPLLLSYIDDLVDEKAEYRELSDIYEQLIDKWLQREVNAIEVSKRQERKDTLYRFSSDIAIAIYENWRKTKKMQLTINQMNEFMSKYGYDSVPYQIKQRSLINRNISGEYKFSHKSFLEFFLAKKKYEDNTFDFQFEGMDMAKDFFSGFCSQEYSKFEKLGYFEVTVPKRFFPETKLTIKKIKKYQLSHLRPALNSLKIIPNSVTFSWKLYNDDLLEFLKDIRVENIVITDYYTIGEQSPKSLLDITSIVHIEFNGRELEALPKSYINQARRLGVTTTYNGIVITQSDIIGRTVPYSMQIALMLERRKHLMDQLDVKKYEALIGPLMNDVNEKSQN